MGVIGRIVLGLPAGAAAKVLLPGRAPDGLIGTTLIGGSLVLLIGCRLLFGDSRDRPPPGRPDGIRAGAAPRNPAPGAPA